MNTDIPRMSEIEIEESLRMAATLERRRHPKILHEPGDKLNQVFNFMMSDSYMQPHLHPGVEKVEFIYLISGKLAVIFFNDSGALTEITILRRGGVELIKVPAFTWHTYVVLSANAVTYETMDGVYDPATWKKLAQWAPQEGGVESIDYLKDLRKRCEVADLNS
jgi:cupin fold WbuC family metalloprotein